jgi:membrane protein implicated in regulation of membrane protease activity
MYGTWFTVTFGIFAAAIVIIMVAAAPWSPIFAFLIAAAAFALFVVRRITKRAGQADSAPSQSQSADSGGAWGETRHPEARETSESAS